jgi:hypothetical protein
MHRISAERPRKLACEAQAAGFWVVCDDDMVEVVLVVVLKQ